MKNSIVIINNFIEKNRYIYKKQHTQEARKREREKEGKKALHNKNNYYYETEFHQEIMLLL
jgi:hypothetical protein